MRLLTPSNRNRQLSSRSSRSFIGGTSGAVPSNAMLWPDGTPVLWPDGSYVLWPN